MNSVVTSAFLNHKVMNTIRILFIPIIVELQIQYSTIQMWK